MIGKLVLAALLITAAATEAKDNKKKTPEPSALDRWVAEDAHSEPPPTTTGSLWTPGAQLGALGRDLRASQVDDLVTIVVAENASAVSSGTVKTQRSAAAKANISAIGRKYGGASALANLADLSGTSTLDGQGSTGRQTTLTTSISARVTRVLSNGYIVVEGKKNVIINSEQQVITVRGVVRPVDVTPDNTVQSDRVAQMEIAVNGKGVVGDAIRRPMILYRILMGLLPF